VAGDGGAYKIVASGEHLARTLTAKGRMRPAAVITWHPAMPQNRIDVEHIAREVGDLADVYYLENGPETFSFGDALPRGAHVYGNAARVYSADLDWMQDVYRSPLRMAQSPVAAAQAAELIIEDVLSRLSAPPPAVVPKRLEKKDGVVKAFASGGSRAIVELADGQRCTIQREHVLPPVRLDWMLAEGGAVSGLHDAEAGTLDVSALKVVPRLTDLYSSGDLVLALVEEVTCKAATLNLFPGSSWPVPLERMSSNPLDTAASLVTEGEVVVVRFLRDKGAVVLSLIDVDDEEEVRSAPELLLGGTPWLKAGRHLLERAGPAAVEASVAARAGAPPGAGMPASGSPAAESTAARGKPATPAAAGGNATSPSAALISVQLSLATEKAEVARLQELVRAGSRAGPELLRLERELVALQGELELERRQAAASGELLAGLAARNAKQLDDLRTLRARNREMQQALKRSRDDPAGAFETVDERVRHDIYLAWVRNVPGEDKSRFPLPRAFSVGPAFAASLYSRTEQGGVPKALKAVVEVLTGLAERSSAREVHPLRTNGGGDAPQVQREDGARCFRASIERGVASARRLHYWKTPDGEVELSRIVLHDDFKP
jgi:hypothetical protein